MTIPAVLAVIQDAVWIALLVCGPLLVISSAIGLLVSVLQAITQINDATLTFIPKIATSALVMLVMGSWMLKTLVDFVARMLSGPAPS